MNKTKKMMCLGLVVIMLLSFVACGASGDVLKGTWSGPDDNYGTVTWTFDGSGKCTLKNDYFTGDGTYTIENDSVTIKLEIWDSSVEYNFVIADKTITMTSVTGLAPDYTLEKK